MNIWNCIKIGESTWGAPKSETHNDFGLSFWEFIYFFSLHFSLMQYLRCFVFFCLKKNKYHRLQTESRMSVCLFSSGWNMLGIHEKRKSRTKSEHDKNMKCIFADSPCGATKSTPTIKENVMRKTSIKCSFIEFHWTWYKYNSWKLTRSTMFHTPKGSTLYTWNRRRNEWKWQMVCEIHPRLA